MVQRLRGDAGSNAVEFALVLPILLAIVLAILWGGLALNSQMALSQTAREAARYGATLPYPTDMAAWLDDVEDRLRDSAEEQLTSGELAGCIRAYEEDTLLAWRAINGGTCPGSTLATGATANESRVEIETSSPATFDFYFGGGAVTLTGDAIARYEGPEWGGAP